MNEFIAAWTPRVLSVLRFITGFLFLWHGSQKLFGYPPPPPPLPCAPPSPGMPAALAMVGGILEFAGGLLILIGLFTRPVAFILSGMMAVAYFMAHAAGGFLPIVNKGELAVIYCFVFFYLAFAGGGEWSLDNLIGKRKEG